MKIERKYMAHYLNAAFGSGDASYTRLGSDLEEYSLAMQQMIAIARAVDMDCKVLVLDEPFNAMDRDAMEEVHALLRQFREAGKTILLASHSAADIAKACDIVYEMEAGRLRRAVPAERN